ncbi:hypothetical protein L3Q82_026271 [Scortum barcoo]|uniref:Uncharacterized protein n=1 Tax=Scortum barcoo TaxID=214431 RepID=A0ACB8WI68_9TELE|nr:hypothetical protein L3Q82_026271 [Scortum barcoo]
MIDSCRDEAAIFQAVSFQNKRESLQTHRLSLSLRGVEESDLRGGSTSSVLHKKEKKKKRRRKEEREDRGVTSLPAERPGGGRQRRSVVDAGTDASCAAAHDHHLHLQHTQQQESLRDDAEPQCGPGADVTEHTEREQGGSGGRLHRPLPSSPLASPCRDMSSLTVEEDQRWVPTHVQVTVLRGRGKLTGQGQARHQRRVHHHPARQGEVLDLRGGEDHRAGVEGGVLLRAAARRAGEERRPGRELRAGADRDAPGAHRTGRVPGSGGDPAR